jgi:hypothetical protein
MSLSDDEDGFGILPDTARRIWQRWPRFGICFENRFGSVWSLGNDEESVAVPISRRRGTFRIRPMNASDRAK